MFESTIEVCQSCSFIRTFIVIGNKKFEFEVCLSGCSVHNVTYTT